MTGLDYEVWYDNVHNFSRILVSHRRTGAPEGALTRTVRAPAAMWTLRLVESVGDGAADAVVVALDISTRQARRRKKALSVGINEVGTTPTRARFNVLADVSPQCRNRDTEMQRRFCTPLFVRKVDIGDGQAAVEKDFENESFEFAKKAIRRGLVMGRLAARCERSRNLNSSRSSMIRLCSLLMSATNPSMGQSKMLTGSISPAAWAHRLRNSKLIAFARSNSSRNCTASALSEARKVRQRFFLLSWWKGPCAQESVLPGR
jgi:hypothetical protein